MDKNFPCYKSTFISFYKRIIHGILVIDDIPNYDVLKLIMKCCDAGVLVIASVYLNNIQHTLESLFEMEPKNKFYLKNA